MPAVPSSLLEPIWVEFAALLPQRPEFNPDHPLGCHRRRIPDRVVFEHLVAAYIDSLPAYAPICGTDAASVDGTSFQEWGSLARELAALFDLHVGDRLLVDAREHEHPVKWLLAPLAAGASVVVCANLNPDLLASQIAAERITRVL